MSFLGLLNYYRSFVKNAAAFLAPLTNVLKGGPQSPFVWTPERQSAFVNAKTSLKQNNLFGFSREETGAVRGCGCQYDAHRRCTATEDICGELLGTFGFLFKETAGSSTQLLGI
jgi:hypothetical protein